MAEHVAKNHPQAAEARCLDCDPAHYLGTTSQKGPSRSGRI